MKTKRMAAIFLAALLTVPSWGMTAQAAFSDVSSTAWYAQDVAAAEQYGILQGTGNGRFSPDGKLTLAQAITMAARTYAYSNHETIPQTGGSAWYSDALQYASDKGICAMGEFGTSYNNFCNRLTMAKLFARVVPADTDQVLNDVTSLPDVQAVQENQAVFDLYRLGILTGSDKYGSFHPYQHIKRSETAAILNRVLAPENRKTVTLEPPPSTEDIYLSEAIPHALNNLEQEEGIYMMDTLGDIGYAFYDIDGNGINEFLVGFTNFPTAIYGIYTIQNYHAKPLIMGNTIGYCYSPCYIYNDRIISYHWLVNDGYGADGEAYYRFTGNTSLSFIEAWDSTGDEFGGEHYYYSAISTDDLWSTFAPEVSESFVQNIRDKYGNPLKFQYTPVS